MKTIIHKKSRFKTQEIWRRFTYAILVVGNGVDKGGNIIENMRGDGKEN
jgi:hypothetical protein